MKVAGTSTTWLGTTLMRSLKPYCIQCTLSMQKWQAHVEIDTLPWAKKAIAAIWEYAISIWKFRNSVEFKLESLYTKLHHEFHLYVNDPSLEFRSFPLYSHRNHFLISREWIEILSHTGYAQSWRLCITSLTSTLFVPCRIWPGWLSLYFVGSKIPIHFVDVVLLST
jgi:hypothetical protein